MKITCPDTSAYLLVQEERCASHSRSTNSQDCHCKSGHLRHCLRGGVLDLSACTCKTRHFHVSALPFAVDSAGQPGSMAERSQACRHSQAASALLSWLQRATCTCSASRQRRCAYRHSHAAQLSGTQSTHQAILSSRRGGLHARTTPVFQTTRCRQAREPAAGVPGASVPWR